MVGNNKNITIPSDLLKQLAALLPNADGEEVRLEFGNAALSATWDDDVALLSMRALSGTLLGLEKLIQIVATA